MVRVRIGALCSARRKRIRVSVLVSVRISGIGRIRIIIKV